MRSGPRRIHTFSSSFESGDGTRRRRQQSLCTSKTVSDKHAIADPRGFGRAWRESPRFRGLQKGMCFKKKAPEDSGAFG
jgi:hypothetical protein